MDTMEQTALGTLRERAKVALAERREKDAEKERRRLADQVRTSQYAWWCALSQRLGIERDRSDLPWTLDSFWVEDSITFGFDPYDGDFSIFAPCRQCGAMAVQRVVEEGLISVAEFLEGLQPQNRCSDCQRKELEARRNAVVLPAAEASKPTLAEELANAFRRIVREELEARDVG